MLHRGSPPVIKPPDHLVNMSEKREWLERELPISEDMKRSLAYRTLTDEAAVVLLLLLHKQRGWS